MFKHIKVGSVVLVALFCFCGQKQEKVGPEKSAVSKNVSSTPRQEENSNKANAAADSSTTTDTLKGIKEASGDLDGDNKDELVAVYNFYGTNRLIRIFKKENDRLILWHETSGAVLPSDHGGMMGDPFTGIKIERGCIVITHFGGSREKWNYTHRYRFQNGNWYLIGATISFGSPCDRFEKYDYNLSTGKCNVDIEIDSCDENDATKNSIKKEKYSFTKKPIKPILMDGFNPGDNEVVIPGKKDKTFYY